MRAERGPTYDTGRENQYPTRNQRVAKTHRRNSPRPPVFHTLWRCASYMRTALKSTRARSSVRSVKDLDLVTKEKTMKLARFIKDATYSAVAMTLCVAMIAAPIATQAQQQQQDPNMQGPPPQDAQQQGPPPSFSPAQLDQITGR